MKPKRDYLNLALRAIILLLTALLLYWGIQLLLGGSPTLAQYLMSFVVALAVLVMQLYYKTGKLTEFVEGTFPRFEYSVERSFGRMKEDIDFIKGDVRGMKQDVDFIKSNITSINKKLKI